MSATPSQEDPPTEPPSPCSPLNLWHQRLNHASTTRLSKLPYIKSNFKSSECVHCIRAKMHKKQFEHVEMETSHKGQLIHSDIVGPFNTAKNKSKYVLTFLDDFTHMCWTKTLLDKSSKSVRNAFQEWIKEFENKGVKIQFLRTDNGGEYEKDLVPVLTSLGITHQTTPPHSPPSNGKAERLNRVLEESVRAMLFQANMPASFWAEAMETAAYVANLLPSRAINNQIPWELWYGKRLTIETLRKLHPFGTIVHVHIPRQRRWTKGKFTTRATIGCFMGYQISHTGEPTDNYKFWDFDRKCFDTSHSMIMTTKFPKNGDFDEPPIAPPLPVAVTTEGNDEITSTPETASTSQQPTPATSQPTPPQQTHEPRPIFDSITVEPPVALEVFSLTQSLLDSEPATIQQAMQRPDAHEWLKAMREELDSIKRNKTWVLCDLPRGRKCIGTRWVFKVKRDGNNKFLRYKCRIVAKGYAQIPGVDYDKTFAPVVRIESIRCLISIVAHRRWTMIHVDFKTAFLNGNSDWSIYIRQPEGFISKKYPHKVLRLNKSLYGLKQAPRIWYLLLCSVIQSLDFAPLESDPSIYVSFTRAVILAVYVDDILIIGPRQHQCNEIFQLLCNHFVVENLGFPKTFLGLNISRHNDGRISIDQRGYIDRIIGIFQMTDAKAASTPLDQSLKLLQATPSDKRCNIKLYQELIGSLNHLATFSRPDIANAVSKLSQFLQDPTETHFTAARHVLRYLKRFRNLRITYGHAKELSVLGYSDSDWGSDLNDRKSTTGYVFMVNKGPVSWNSHKQATVATSSTAAEYMALSDASREALARLHLFEELRIKIPIPVIFSDSTGALQVSEDPTNYQRTKHIDIRYHFIRHVVQNNQIALNYVPGQDNPADAFTKTLGPEKHHTCLQNINLQQ